MASNTTRFPITGHQRAQNRRGPDSINCYVSGRYLRFHDVGDTGVDGLAVVVDVMSDGYGDKPDRKICELVLTLDALKTMAERLEEIRSERNRPD